MFAGKSLVSLDDLTLGGIIAILDCAEEMAEAIGFDEPASRAAAAPLDRILATCFYEPSTRTRLSFACAMLRLGGQVLDLGGREASSLMKGESLADTVRIVSAYSDIIVQRHPLAGAAKVAAEYASVPVINAGDGPHQHPTQTLTDLFWIRRCKGRLEGLKVGLCGDLKYGRTVHSLAPVMAAFGSEVVCIAPDALQMPASYLERCEQHMGRKPVMTGDLAAAVAEMDLDVLYMTRIQRERFDDAAEYEQLKGVYVLTPELMAQAPDDMIVLHPLPRVDEIDPAVDADPRAQYFRQAAGGVPVRMALIALLLGLVEPKTGHSADRYDLPEPGRAAAEAPAAGDDGWRQSEPEVVTDVGRCANPRCITTAETYLPARFYKLADGTLRCVYCEQELSRT